MSREVPRANQLEKKIKSVHINVQYIYLLQKSLNTYINP
jgi:hypothetical protein